jgi:long-chain acyl-CoA synthetase
MSPLQAPERLSADLRRREVPVLLASPEVLARPGVQDAAAESGLMLRLDPAGAVRPAAGAVPADPGCNPGVAVEMPTSGTTGPPKRVRLTDRRLDDGMVSGGQPLPDGTLLRAGIALAHTRLVRIGGLWGILATLYAGRRALVFARWQLDPAAVESYRPRTSGLVPAALRTMIDADVPKEKPASLQAVVSGTAPPGDPARASP